MEKFAQNSPARMRDFSETQEKDYGGQTDDIDFKVNSLAEKLKKIQGLEESKFNVIAI